MGKDLMPTTLTLWTTESTNRSATLRVPSTIRQSNICFSVLVEHWSILSILVKQPCVWARTDADGLTSFLIPGCLLLLLRRHLCLPSVWTWTLQLALTGNPWPFPPRSPSRQISSQRRRNWKTNTASTSTCCVRKKSFPTRSKSLLSGTRKSLLVVKRLSSWWLSVWHTVSNWSCKPEATLTMRPPLDPSTPFGCRSEEFFTASSSIRTAPWLPWRFSVRTSCRAASSVPNIATDFTLRTTTPPNFLGPRFRPRLWKTTTGTIWIFTSLPRVTRIFRWRKAWNFGAFACVFCLCPSTRPPRKDSWMHRSSVAMPIK